MYQNWISICPHSFSSTFTFKLPLLSSSDHLKLIIFWGVH